jgi:hypothetical protein
LKRKVLLLFQKLEQLQKKAKFSTAGAAILAFLSGIAGLFTTNENFSLLATWVTVILAFLSAALGVSSLLIEKHKDTAEKIFKKTKPNMNIDIKTGESNKKLLVVIEPLNEVPFEYNYKIVTRNNIIISGIFLEWGKIYPSKDQPYLLELANIDLSKVIDDYVELRFNYRSIYSIELNDSNLTGKLIKSYRLARDKTHVIPIQ